MQGGGELPWEVTCRGVVDGIAMVIHMTRHEGRRFVEEAVFVKGYEAKDNQWDIHENRGSKGLDLTPATESKANRLEHPDCRACVAHYQRSTRSDHGAGRAR